MVRNVEITAEMQYAKWQKQLSADDDIMLSVLVNVSAHVFLSVPALSYAADMSKVYSSFAWSRAHKGPTNLEFSIRGD